MLIDNGLISISKDAYDGDFGYTILEEKIVKGKKVLILECNDVIIPFMKSGIMRNLKFTL